MKNNVPLLTIISLLLAVVSQACNLYDSSISGDSQSFLCANEVCTISGGKSQQCQSGCCHDDKCNADGACVRFQFIMSIVAIVIIFSIGLAVYFTY